MKFSTALATTLIASLAATLTACAPGHADMAARQQTPSPIAVERAGNPDGRTVVLVPGLASSAAVWNDTVAALSPDYDLRIVQVAGFAGAPTVAADGSIVDGIVAALSAHLTDHPGHETLVAGHSMGGFIALNLAKAAPEQVSEVFVVDSLPFIAALFLPGASPQQAASTGLAMAVQLKAMPRDAFDAQQAAAFSRLTLTAEFRSELEAWSLASDQAFVADVLGELMAADFRADMADVEQATTVLVPWDASIPFSVDQVLSLYQEQYAAAPDAQVVVIEGSYHFIMIDQPAAYLAALRDALTD